MLIRKVFWLIQFPAAEQTCWFSYFVIIHCSHAGCLQRSITFSKNGLNHICCKFNENVGKHIFNAVVLQSFDE